MKCDFGAIVGWILGAIGMLAVAIVIAQLWPYVGPLFAAAALIVLVSAVFFTNIKNDLSMCPASCSISSLINTLGQAATALAAIPFFLAALLQIKGLALIATHILAPFGILVEAAVGLLVTAGTIACVIVIGILIGLLVQVIASKSCLESQGSPPRP